MSVIVLAPKTPIPGTGGSGGGVVMPPVVTPPGGGATPPVVRPPTVPPRFDPDPLSYGMRHFLDTDYGTWEITDYTSGIFLTRGGLRGLHHPPVTSYTRKAPSLAGAKWRGQIVEPRPVFWPTFVYSDEGSQAWSDFDEKLWRALQPGAEVRWRVVGMNTTTRTLTMRVDAGDDQTYDMDPMKHGWTVYGMNFTAYDPFWHGAAVERAWVDEERRDYYGGAAKGPPLFISSASTISTASIKNDGDVESYITWTIFGPTTNIEVGVGSRLIKAPLSIPAGKGLYVDPSPGAQSALIYPVLAGGGGLDFTATPQDVTPQLTDPPDWRGSIVPAGQEVLLTLNLEALGGYVLSSMRPSYYRGFPR